MREWPQPARTVPVTPGLSPIPVPSPARPGRARAAAARVPGIAWVAVAWLVFEFGRPPTPTGAPLLLTAVMLFWWLRQPKKVLTARDIAWLGLVLTSAIGMGFAANQYAAFQTTQFFAILFLTVCLPLQTLATDSRATRLWILGFIATSTYVAVWAATHGGFGPAGTSGHDENYVAAIVTISAGMAYFALGLERRFLARALLSFSIVAAVAAMAVAQNPSRGGFLALLAVTAYIVWRSPRKLLVIGAIATAGVLLLALAGDRFWAEISTTTDYSSGTGDVRLEIWKSGVSMWQANPIFGVGGGNFRWRIGDFQTEAQLVKFGRSLGGSIVAHSMHVELLSELGAAGVACFLVLLVHTWRGLGRVLLSPAKLRSKKTSPEARTLSLFADALRVGMVAVLVNGVFLSLLYYSHFWILVAMGTGVIRAHQRLRAADSAHLRGDGAPRAPVNALRTSR